MPSKRFKRDYSRGGCRECKRRKIKCNEAKPHCSECTRLGKICAYPVEGERVIRGSKKIIEEKKEPSPVNNVPSTKRVRRVQMYMGPGQPKRKMKWDKGPELADEVVPKETVNTTPLNTHHEAEQLNTEHTTAVPEAELLPSTIAPGGLYNNDDLNLLATDLNNLVNDIMFSSNIAQSFDNQLDFFDPTSITAPFLDDIPKNIPKNYIELKTDDEKRYMTQFYEDFASQILPFGADVKECPWYINPFRDVIMKYAARERFLLAAVLSQGARLASELQKEKERRRDMENCANYLSTCLKLLSPALTRNQEKEVKGDLTSNIESILLTVLLLASSSASNEKQSWRPHLQGAKEIIMKATHSKIRSSTTLIMCKLWFADFEILAGLSSGLGGTLRTKEEMDLVFNFDAYELEVLKEFGLVQESGFCIVMGYHIDCLEYFKDLSNLIRLKRSNPEKSSDPLECARLIGGFRNQYDKKFAEIESRFDGEFSNGLLCDMVQLPENKLKMISWSDISQQAYTLAGLVTVFTRLLEMSVDSPHVKILVAKLVALIKVFENSRAHGTMSFPFAFSMLQWPMSIAGFACTEPLEHPTIETFFGLCYRTGSYSANLTLERIKKVWELRKAGKTVDYVDGESNIDRITY
ncbi:hypothetical protein I9W82_003833 [Candida metapsilosis]|uniref:Zn(2)-C6 fungal-type domain-containing protein n=1 Tax=Candida metapsilosis TaxID=273372 RepID=A0A8H7ZF49_9ASCO|nr:hypothetical protein I9W82_003833 [Candida metapsilosis]